MHLFCPGTRMPPRTFPQLTQQAGNKPGCVVNAGGWVGMNCLEAVETGGRGLQELPNAPILSEHCEHSTALQQPFEVTDHCFSQNTKCSPSLKNFQIIKQCRKWSSHPCKF